MAVDSKGKGKASKGKEEEAEVRPPAPTPRKSIKRKTTDAPTTSKIAPTHERLPNKTSPPCTLKIVLTRPLPMSLRDNTGDMAKVQQRAAQGRPMISANTEYL